MRTVVPASSPCATFLPRLNIDVVPYFPPKYCTRMHSSSFSIGISTNTRKRSIISMQLSPVGTHHVPSSVPVRVAHELLQAGHHYLDVRTNDEFTSGHVVGAVNVPIMFKLGSGLIRNPRFVEEVLSHFGKDDEIIVGCQLGKRSLMASSDLLSAGFTGITDMAGGYAAWNQIGLPTECD